MSDDYVTGVGIIADDTTTSDDGDFDPNAVDSDDFLDDEKDALLEGEDAEEPAAGYFDDEDE